MCNQGNFGTVTDEFQRVLVFRERRIKIRGRHQHIVLVFAVCVVVDVLAQLLQAGGVSWTKTALRCEPARARRKVVAERACDSPAPKPAAELRIDDHTGARIGGRVDVRVQERMTRNRSCVMMVEILDRNAARQKRDLLFERGEAKPAQHGEDATELAACGYALHGMELRIVGENGEVLDERHVGCIEFRGNAATRGYLRNEVQTARLIHDGWLDTGGLGYLAEGELYVTGGLKDMIIRAGRHFFPYELEEAIGKLPGVAHGGVAVCGRPDAQGGTARLVIIVETTSTDEAARTLLKTRIKEATVVCFGAPAEEIALVPPDTILKTPGGKIRHAATLKRFEERGQATTRLGLSRQWVHIAVGSLALACRNLAARSARILRGLACGSAVLLRGLWVRCRVAFSSDTARNWRIAARACRLFLRVAGVRVTLDGERTTLLDTRPIFAANHTSYLDVIVLTAALPWPVNFVAKRELSDRIIVGLILRRLGTRFVERDVFSGSVADETQLVRHASEGDSLFFPEGTFVRSAGVREFHLGAFRAACVTQRPVAPVVLRGTRAVLRDGDWIPRPGPVTVSVFAPIAPAGADFFAAARMRDAVRDVIVQHSGEPDTTQ